MMAATQLKPLLLSDFNKLTKVLLDKEFAIILFLFGTKKGKNMGKQKLALAAEKMEIGCARARLIRDAALSKIRKEGEHMYQRLRAKGIQGT